MFQELRDLGGILFSLLTILFVVAVTLRAFMIHDRPSHLHIAMHMVRRSKDGKRYLKYPTMSRMELPNIYERLTSTWVLLLTPYWARGHAHSPVVRVPRSEKLKLGWTRCMWYLSPSIKNILEPLKRYLSEEHAQLWVERATTTGRRCKVGREREFVLALVHEDSAPALRAVVIRRTLLEKIGADPSYIADEPHPLYREGSMRVATIRKLAKTFLEWKKAPKDSDLALAIIEL